jgi:hypothetical protein
MLDLIDLFEKIQLPKVENSNSNKHHYSALPIPGYPNHRIAKDINGYPSILISTSSNPPDFKSYPNVRLEHLSIIYNAECNIYLNSNIKKYKLTVISCNENDKDLQKYFLRTCSSVIYSIGNNPSIEEIDSAINKLIELFRAMKQPQRKSVQGLWAELLVIHLSSNPAVLLKSWHQSPLDKFDFSYLNQHIEVKSCSLGKRIHHFGLEQLIPMKNNSIMIASLFVERIGTGIAISELAYLIKKRLSFHPELSIYLDHVISITLGNKWDSAIKDRFNFDVAKKSIIIYSSENIPKISTNFPTEISDVHFRVDLTSLKSIDKSLLKSQNGIFSSLLPK